MRILEEIADAWRSICPGSYREFLEIIDEESKQLIKPTAMSTDGTMLNWGKLPTDLYAFVKHQMRKRAGIDDFFRDPENYRLLAKVWSDTRIRRTPTNMLFTSDLKLEE